MAASETERHRELKRFALSWAQLHGYRIAACEVSIPHLRVRLDVAAYRPEGRHEPTGAGTTILFECKQSRADFLKDSRCREKITGRLATLHERRERYEEFLRVRIPSVRNGDALFPEFDSCRYERAGYEAYDKLTKELRMLAGRLHQQTKFSDLHRWKAANLHYVVAHPGVAQPHELPYGWGLLVTTSEGLHMAAEPTWTDASAPSRLSLLQSIAIAATKAVNQAMGIVLPVAPGRGRSFQSKP